jgi:hypothetical protein
LGHDEGKQKCHSILIYRDTQTSRNLTSNFCKLNLIIQRSHQLINLTKLGLPSAISTIVILSLLALPGAKLILAADILILGPLSYSRRISSTRSQSITTIYSLIESRLANNVDATIIANAKHDASSTTLTND